MKNSWIIVLLVLSGVACSEDETPRAKHMGKGDLLENGEERSIKVLAGSAGCDDNLSLAISYNDTLYARDVSIILGNFPAREGKYVLRRREAGQNECALNITPVSHYFYYFGNGGRPTTVCDLAEEEVFNELVITRYDSMNQQLEGRFQMTLVLREAFEADNDEFSDTLRITYGAFETDILPDE